MVRWTKFVTRWGLASLLAWGAGSWVASTADAADVAIGPALAKVRAIGPKGAGHREAIEGVKTLSQADAQQLPQILAGMDSANLLAANWIRAVCESVAQRAVDGGGKLPVAELEKFLGDSSLDPLARRLAYELIAKVDKDAESRLIPPLVNDVSLELRRDAVTLAIAKAATSTATADKGTAIKTYRELFKSTRDHDQIKLVADKLRELGETVDVATHYGFVMNWQVVAPFDNVDRKGFDVAYAPETEVKLDASYDGKAGKISWKSISTKNDLGVIDLNTSLDKHKGAIAYAYATFVASKEQDVELRLGTPNANKIWLNGQLVATNNIYHANTSVDQYVGRGKLQAGRNTILLKIAQNEQTEAWAQDWKFQLRVCDKIGTAVLSQDRPTEQTASVSK